MKSLEYLGKHIQACGFVGTNGDGASRSVGLIGYHPQRLLPQREHAPGVFKQHLARWCEPDRFSQPAKQFLAVFLFELANLSADG